ncbi:MAG: 2OG-Fe(II) oxygenase [Candidatus Nanopelagicales bacterium]
MFHLIKHKEGFISEENLKIILDYAKNNPDTFSEYGNSEKQFKVSLIQSGDNADLVRNIMSSHDEKVFDFLTTSYDYEFKPYESMIHIARFEEGSGMHVHFDSSRPDDIATIIYLNDDYEGGEIYFPEHGITIKPKAGDLVSFPDNEDFKHGVKNTKGGVRYTTPRWFTTIKSSAKSSAVGSNPSAST